MKDFFRMLRRFVAPYKWNVVLNVLFNMLAAVLTLFSFAFIIPILNMLFRLDTTRYEYMEWGAASVKEVVMNNFYYYTDQMIVSRGASATLALLAVLLVLMTLLKTGTTYLSAYFIIPLRNGVVRDIRNRMYSKILSLPLGFFTNERKGDVMSRISVDVTELEASVMASIDMLFKNPIMIIVCLGMMIAVSWQLTVFVLILLPLAGLVMGKVGKRLKRKSLEAQQQWGTILSTVEETLGGLRVIKAFNAEKKMDRRFDAENQRFFRISNSIQRRYSLAHPMSEFLGTAAIAIVLWFGGTLILSGSSSIDAPAFIYYMVIFLLYHKSCKRVVQSHLFHTERHGLDAAYRQDTAVRQSDKGCCQSGKASGIVLGSCRTARYKLQRCRFQLYWRNPGAEECQSGCDAGPDCGHCGAERFGQEHAGGPAAALL